MTNQEINNEQKLTFQLGATVYHKIHGTGEIYGIDGEKIKVAFYEWSVSDNLELTKNDVSLRNIWN